MMESNKKSLFVKIKTMILMLLPLGFYIFVLKKISNTRLSDYSGVLGTDPKSVIVADGVVMLDLNDMVI